MSTHFSVPPAQNPPPRKRKKWPWITAAVAALFLIIGISTITHGGQNPATATVTPAATAPAQVETDRNAQQIGYEVTTTGSGILAVTFMKPLFQIAQETAIKGQKWATTVEAYGPAPGVSLTAQNKGGGTITCKITRGGRVVAENSSTGDYAIVSCAL
ncbi:MmpS family transport accessory protein [Amycolatopsis anabasis]|uniref:MmpS family transport accessory protein n=1 Tax=Amycolatopsis anabasis TaxID=1840409 RepID=UPI00131ABD38|nr:MmpS family transport accessory protein [Amycolatopsis anabasis]